MSDREIRLAAFEWLRKQTDFHGELLPWALLLLGFEHHGERIPLVSQQGIFKPRALELPISIRTSAEPRYDDSFGADGLLHYRYRGTDPGHHDNRLLREAYRRRVPLVYFHGLAKGRYVAVWPVYIVGDDPRALAFTVAVDDATVALREWQTAENADLVREDEAAARREYVTALVRRRLHQRSFRDKVLRAYREQCALCRLHHEELLDAAHIVADRDEGPPLVNNGIALCKLHHAAFDSFFLTIRPDYLVEVRRDILDESDGPMLLHGLQPLDGRRIIVPRRPELRPDPELLARRHERFISSLGR
jgi:putative restriction endonuclease